MFAVIFEIKMFRLSKQEEYIRKVLEIKSIVKNQWE